MYRTFTNIVTMQILVELAKIEEGRKEEFCFQNLFETTRLPEITKST